MGLACPPAPWRRPAHTGGEGKGDAGAGPGGRKGKGCDGQALEAERGRAMLVQALEAGCLK